MSKGLVLTRRIGESIKIGDDITVEVDEVRGRQVRLRINAPRELEVTRSGAPKKRTLVRQAVEERECVACKQPLHRVDEGPMWRCDNCGSVYGIIPRPVEGREL